MEQFSSVDMLNADIPELPIPTLVSEALRRELNSYKQAMPLSRLLGNGMEYTDALAIHTMADQGIPWADAGEWLGKRNLRRARDAQSAGHLLTARSYYRFASACFRFGQVAFREDTERKRSMYALLIETFGAAGALDNPPIQKVEVPYREGKLCGWLMLPAGILAPPVVIALGGFDGWREEYFGGASYLIERGMAVLLVDAPGQGETRLFHHLYLTADIAHAFSCLIDYLLHDSRVGSHVGIWGNSFGGLLAALAASADHRIEACCVNGSPARPVESLDRFPPLLAQAGAMIGTTDLDTVRTVLGQLSLTPETNHIQLALLQLHGALDPICPLEAARPIYDEAPGSDKQIIIWPDGNHCVYNHSHEKHSIVADWFHDRLCRSSSGNKGQEGM